VKRPVPHWSVCKKTVETTARVWAAKFSRRSARRETPVLVLDDLIQEGWLIAHKVLRTYDPARGAKIETVLFVALHRHYARLLKQSLERTFKYTAEQQVRIADFELFQRYSNPSRRKINLIMAKIAELTDEERTLVCDLVTMKQNAEKIARKRQWSLPFTQQRIDELKAVLKGAI
jgi:DNA-directed RNA polymerase specialized sigma24 family protein